jgi:hypothetical protein
VTVHDLVLALAEYAAKTPDASVVFEDDEAPGWANQYPDVTTIRRLPDGRVVIG